MKQDKGTIEIKRSLQRKMVGRKEVAKAIALSLYVKSIVRSSTVKNFTYDKMRTLTGLGISSLRKRIDILKRLGLVSFIGKNKEHICFSSMTGSRKRANIDISYFKYKNIKEVENSVFASLLIEIQRHKDFAKYAIRCAHDGRNLKEIKRGRRLCRRYDYGKEYVEYGISLKRIAREMGLCVKTALSIVNWAVKNKLIIKEHIQKEEYCKGIGFGAKYLSKEEKNFTFCTKDNKYYIFANNYVLTSRTALRFSNDTPGWLY